MVKFKKKKKPKTYKSVYGDNLDLIIEDEGSSITIKVFKSVYYSIYKKVVVLLIISGINFLCLYFHILSLQMMTAIFCLWILIFWKLTKTLKEETLVMVKDLGLELTQKYLLGCKSIFIPYEEVQRLFINEVIFRHKVIFLLSLLVKNEKDDEKLVPLFSGTLPRLSCLNIIYNRTKKYHKPVIINDKSKTCSNSFH